ncbi:MAG: dienelactone hydrolase family protein [Verrucomicrobiota bacterium]
MRTQLLLATITSIGCLSHFALAEIKTETVEYKDGATVLQGIQSYDDTIKGKRPGVLIVHDWMGVTEHTKAIAEEMASLGYVAFAADIYGKGVRPADTTAASAEAGKYKGDRPLLRKRATAGLEELQKHSLTDSKHIAAIGFCFGGTTVLELARSGAKIQGVVSFHGGLDSPTPADGKNIKSKILVLHGADDPFVKPADIAAFQEELRQGGADWQMMYYGDAVHSFTQKKAGTDKSKGAAYNEPAARRSWQAMKTFFGELFTGK